MIRIPVRERKRDRDIKQREKEQDTQKHKENFLKSKDIISQIETHGKTYTKVHHLKTLEDRAKRRSHQFPERKKQKQKHIIYKGSRITMVSSFLIAIPEAKKRPTREWT